MKYLLLGLLFIPNILLSQQTAQFETTIYLEDTLGNKDSVIIGYDVNETFQFMNPNFGEVDITNLPWDSIFEARVLPRFTNNQNQSKKHIKYSNCNNTTTNLVNGEFASVEFTIAVRLTTPYSPLIIRWNNNDFANDICRRGSFIVESPMYFNEPNPQGFGEVYMINGSTYGTLWGGGGAGHGFYAVDEAGNQAFVNAFIISIAKNYPTSTIEQQIQQESKIYPNPTTDNFTIELPESYFSESVQIFDITGCEVYQSMEKLNQINVPSATWAKGIYFYQVRLDDGIEVSGKVVKN